MSDKGIDHELIQRELHDAVNALRKSQGLEPLPFSYKEPTVSPDSGSFEYCSFCGKAKDEVKKLVAGPSVFICN
jgi:hypothetical protein